MSSKHSGSVTFGTRIVKTDEYVLLAKVMKDDNMSVEETALHIEAIDDMLVLQRNRSMLNTMRRTPTGRIRKDSDFLSILDRRVGILVKDLKAINHEN